MTPILSIEYDDANQGSYQGVTLSFVNPSAEVERWDYRSGRLELDWHMAMRGFWGYLMLEGTMPDDATLMYSSSVDHFMMDGQTYHWGTVIIDDVLAVDGNRYTIEVESPVLAVTPASEFSCLT